MLAVVLLGPGHSLVNGETRDDDSSEQPEHEKSPKLIPSRAESTGQDIDPEGLDVPPKRGERGGQARRNQGLYRSDQQSQASQRVDPIQSEPFPSASNANDPARTDEHQHRRDDHKPPAADSRHLLDGQIRAHEHPARGEISEGHQQYQRRHHEKGTPPPHQQGEGADDCPDNYGCGAVQNQHAVLPSSIGATLDAMDASSAESDFLRRPLARAGRLLGY